MYTNVQSDNVQTMTRQTVQRTVIDHNYVQFKCTMYALAQSNSQIGCVGPQLVCCLALLGVLLVAGTSVSLTLSKSSRWTFSTSMAINLIRRPFSPILSWLTLSYSLLQWKRWFSTKQSLLHTVFHSDWGRGYVVLEMLEAYLMMLTTLSWERSTSTRLSGLNRCHLRIADLNK